MEGTLIEFEEGDSEMEHMLRLKEQIYELEEQLQTIVWDYQTRKRISLKGSNFRTKSISRGLSKMTESEKGFLKELYVQMAVQDYLLDLIGAADRIVEEGNSLYFELNHKIHWLEYFASKYVNQGVERVLIRLKPLVSKNRLSQAEEVFTHLLPSLYRQFFGGELITVPGSHASFLAVEGPGVLELFQQEVGVHLLFLSHESIFPVECSVHRLPAEMKARDFVLQWKEPQEQITDFSKGKVKHIIRLYTFEAQDWASLWHANRKEKQLLRSHLKGTMTDLRSGMVNATNLRKAEFQLLFWESITGKQKS